MKKIVSVGVGVDAPRIYKEAVDLLIKIYSAAIGNFITTHVCLLISTVDSFFTITERKR